MKCLPSEIVSLYRRPESATAVVQICIVVVIAAAAAVVVVIIVVIAVVVVVVVVVVIVVVIIAMTGNTKYQTYPGRIRREASAVHSKARSHSAPHA
jgi:hypothetical protein